MKKLLILSLLFVWCSMNATAQVNDDAVEHMMTERVLNCDDVTYNSLLLIPRLYREKKTDTLKSVLTYWKKNCGLYAPAVSFTLLYSIENNSFREELTNSYRDSSKGNTLTDVLYYKENIISYLYAHKSIFDMKKTPYDYSNYNYKAYTAYGDFIQAMANSLLTKPGLSPAARFLVEFYANPDTVQLTRLADSAYKGSLLQMAYLNVNEFGGVSYGLNFGMWHPDGKLAVLGDHPFLGMFLGGRGGGFSCDVVANFGFQKTPNYYYVKKDDSLYHTNYFVNYYFGLDFGQALFRTRRSELALLAGIAYDGISTINTGTSDDPSNNNDNNNTTGKTLNSLNLNAGIGYKFYYRHIKDTDKHRHSYLGLQAKYNFVSYNNAGGTDLTGRSMTFCLIWGGYSKSIHHYYDDKK